MESLLPLCQFDSLNIEAIVWGNTPLMDQELRWPSCLMPCIKKDHHPCHVPLLLPPARLSGSWQSRNERQNIAGWQYLIRVRQCLDACEMQHLLLYLDVKLLFTIFSEKLTFIFFFFSNIKLKHVVHNDES